MTESGVTSITAEVLATGVSETRGTCVAAKILASASSKALIGAIAMEALVSVAEVPSGVTS